jgi:hypothetical protein
MDDNHTVRVVIDINVESELERDLLMSNTEFKQMAGMAVQAVAANTAKVHVDPRWNNGRGFVVTTHQHYSDPDQYCRDCRSTLAQDEINVPRLSD